MFKIYYILPHLARTGGIKVALQHIHLLGQSGFDVEGIVMSRDHGVDSPFPRYFTILHMYPKIPSINSEDILVFNWPLDIPLFKNVYCKKYYFAQGCLSVRDMPAIVEPFQQYVANDPNMGCLAVSSNSQTYNAIAYKKESSLVRNWIDTSVFKPGTVVPRTVGMISHRQNYDPSLAEVLTSLGLSIVNISGSEYEVAEMMGSM